MWVPVVTAFAVARLGLRRRVGRLVVLAVLVAVVAGTVLTLAGGARRTVGALDRLRDESHAADLFVQPFEVGDRLVELRLNPDVEAVGQRAIAFVRVVGAEPDPLTQSVAGVAVDDQYLATVDRPRVLDGAMPDPEDAASIAVTEAGAAAYGVVVGDTIRVESLTPDQVDAYFFEGQPPGPFEGPTLELTVTGVVRTIDEAVGVNVDHLLLTPAFWEEHRGAIGGFDNLVLVDARDGADLDALTADIRQLWSDDDELFVGGVETVTASLRDLLRTQATGLAVAAIAVAIAGLVVVSQALQRNAPADDDLVLAGLGLTRVQRIIVIAVPLALAVSVGVVVATVGAAVFSRAFPTGRAAIVEPDPGVLPDAPLLLAGGGVTLALFVLVAAVVAGRATRSGGTQLRVGRLTRFVSKGPAAMSAAAHLATRRGVPARPAVAGAVVALAGAVAAGVFGASLVRLIDDPVRDGWGWDAEVGISDSLTDDEALEVARDVADRPNVEAVALARLAQVPVATEDVQAIGLETVEGAIDLTVLEGAAPTQRGHVALGPKTADALDVGVGDSVELQGVEGPPRRYDVTGLLRFPNLGDDTPARGIAMTLDGLSTLLPADSMDGAPGYPTLLTRWSPGTDTASMQADLADEFPLVEGPRASNQVTNLREVRAVAPALVGILAVFGLAAVVHALVASVRRARRDLAVLAVLGFARRQRAVVVVTQSAGYLGLGLVVGIPLGLVAGRLTWRLLADQLAVANDPTVPAWIAVVIPVAALVAIVAAAMPARAAARVRPATDLRVE